MLKFGEENGPLLNLIVTVYRTDPNWAVSSTPDYPDRELARRSQGLIVADAIVEHNGSVSRVIIHSGPAGLADSVTKAVIKWSYHPTNSTESQVKPVAIEFRCTGNNTPTIKSK